MAIMPTERDYSPIGRDAEAATRNGLAAAAWYQTDIPRKRMKELMRRSDGPAIRDPRYDHLARGLCRVRGWRLSHLGDRTWWAVPFSSATACSTGGPRLQLSRIDRL
jgi:hypothetical protein